MTDRRLLLIDDNDDLRTSLARGLRSLGWSVEIACNAKDGLDAAAKAQPLVVVTELILPDIRGFNFARSLRSMVEHDLVVIALTRVAQELHGRALTSGFDHVESKPSNAEQLHAHMMRMMPLPIAS